MTSPSVIAETLGNVQPCFLFHPLGNLRHIPANGIWRSSVEPGTSITQ
jgi:hypothetical protein